MGRPAARIGDLTAHGTPLCPGPGSANVHIGGASAWRGVPLAAAAGLRAAHRAGSAAVKTAEATTKAAGILTRRAAEAGEQDVKAAVLASMSALTGGFAGVSDIHVCPVPTPAPPHGPGVVINGSATVLINNMPACASECTVLEALGGRDRIARGERTVLIGGTAPLAALCPAIAALAGMSPAERAAAEAEILAHMDPVDPALLQLMHDRDMAMLAAAPYATADGSPSILPPGYSAASDADLAALGLARSDLVPDMNVYRTTGADGQPHYVLSFRGTELGAGKGTAAKDIGTDLWQGAGGDSEPYRRGIAVARTMSASGESMEITGHSKGGGQAAAASAATGEEATTFNAAGVHHRTLDRAGVSQANRDAAVDNIRAYNNPNDPLNGAQDDRGAILTALGLGAGYLNPFAGLGVGLLAADGALPPALGTRIETPLGRDQAPGMGAGHSIDTMINTMNEMIEDMLADVCDC